MSDVHVFEDAFKVAEDILQYVTKVEARGWKFSIVNLIGDLGEIRQIAADVQKVVGEAPDMADEIRKLTVDDVQKLFARGIDDLYQAYRLVSPLATRVAQVKVG